MALIPASALVAFALWAGPALAAPTALKLHYAAELLGIDALEFSIAIVQDDGKYRIQVAGTTEGMIDWFVGWRSFTTVDGATRPAETRPEDYHAVNLFRGRRSVVSMHYMPDGAIETKADPPTGDDRDPVGADLQKASVDALTAGLILVKRMATGETCDGRIPVFDGRRRYDLMLEDGGSAAISLRKSLPSVGTAKVCVFRIDRIAGFKKKGQTYDKPEYHERRYRLMAARIVDGFPPLALDVSGEFSLGSFHIRLVKMEKGEPDQMFASSPPFEVPPARRGDSARPPASQPPR